MAALSHRGMIFSVISLCLNPCLSVSIWCRSLTVSTGLTQIIIDHSAPVLLRLGDCRVASFFIPADLIFRVQTFQRELAGGNCLCLIVAIEFKRNQSRLDQ